MDPVKWLEMRRSQCANMLPNGACAAIAVRLGWEDGTHPGLCDQCWAHGPASATSQQLRTAYAKQVVENAAHYGKLQTPTVKRALLTLHGKELSEPHPDEVAATPRLKWLYVRKTWVKAQSLGKSIASGRKVSLEVLEQRKNSCATCPHRTPSRKKGEYYCGACGCGDTALARLDHKLGYTYLECPEAREGFSNATQS